MTIRKTLVATGEDLHALLLAVSAANRNFVTDLIKVDHRV